MNCSRNSRHIGLMISGLVPSSVATFIARSAGTAPLLVAHWETSPGLTPMASEND